MDIPNPDNRGEFFDQFLDDYYAECDEHLFSIRRSLVSLEDEVDSAAVDRTILDNLFRSFQRSKGSPAWSHSALPNNSLTISRVICVSCVKERSCSANRERGGQIPAAPHRLCTRGRPHARPSLRLPIPPPQTRRLRRTRNRRRQPRG
jgi:hypothetical protein